MRKLDDQTVILCGRKKCCPTIRLNDEKTGFTIKDDFGGEIQLNKDEFMMLEDAVAFYKDKLTNPND